MFSLSIIIPTHKRARILRECLWNLEQQTIAPQLEVIVVSDGHDPKTAKLFSGVVKWKVGSVKFFEVEKSQQGVARNYGVREATSPLCLFIGDDIFLEPTACEKHVRSHALRLASLAQGESFATLGFITWDPACDITPMMRWLERSGWQFGFRKIERYRSNVIPRAIQHLFTYTSNISMPTSIVRAVPFREDVRLYGWEDIEWGKRLADTGVALYYEPDARALHHHHIDLEDSLRRMETLGESVVELTKVAPHLDRLPRSLKRIGYEVTAFLPTLSGRHRRAFLHGIRKAQQKTNNPIKQ